MSVTAPILLALAGLLSLLLGGGVFLRRVLRSQVRPGSRILLKTAALALALSTAAIGLAVAQDASLWPVLSLALPPFLLGPALLFLESQRRVPVAGIRVALGQCLLPFEAQLPSGEVFASDSLRGQRVLLKFFRGHWCPFCSVELREFDNMAAELDRYGVRVLALSKDTPEQARYHRLRDGLRLQLLCDPELTVIRKYGLEHRKAFEMSGGQATFLGFPLGRRAHFRSMAAPTTLLIDEWGRIRWIDQTDDYHVRSDRKRVLSAVQAAFGEGAEASLETTKQAAPTTTGSQGTDGEVSRPVELAPCY